MPDALIDPASLDGDALAQWYRRSPADIEQARQAAFAQRYNDFFNRPTSPDPASDRSFGQPLPPSAASLDTGAIQTVGLPQDDPDPGLGLVQIGENRWRTVPRLRRMTAKSSTLRAPR